jgi:predicted 3-demethylubiquinone-9 3-methyltransferase (glyoxalase superfamily)
MENKKQKITNCLWFDSEAEEAVALYTSIFKNSKTGHVARFGKEGFEHHGKPEGSVMTVEFELDGQKFLALNGGPQFKFNEAMSLMVYCENQEEVDHYWNKLSEGGEEGPCGWLKDKFGVSWQVIPEVFTKMMSDPDTSKSRRAMGAVFAMKKFDIAKLEKAFNG